MFREQGAEHLLEEDKGEGGGEYGKETFSSAGRGRRVYYYVAVVKHFAFGAPKTQADLERTKFSSR